MTTSKNPTVANAMEAAKSAKAVNADFHDARRELERLLLEMERIAKEHGHLATRARRVREAVERMAASGAMPDEKRALDGLRRQILMASPFRG